MPPLHVADGDGNDVGDSVASRVLSSDRDPHIVAEAHALTERERVFRAVGVEPMEIKVGVLADERAGEGERSVDFVAVTRMDVVTVPERDVERPELLLVVARREAVAHEEGEGKGDAEPTTAWIVTPGETVEERRAVMTVGEALNDRLAVMTVRDVVGKGEGVARDEANLEFSGDVVARRVVEIVTLVDRVREGRDDAESVTVAVVGMQFASDDEPAGE